MELVMKGGARVGAVDGDGATALVLAIEAGQPGAVRFLLKASPEVTLRQGQTLTALAAKQVEVNQHSIAAFEVQEAIAAACEGAVAGEGKEGEPSPGAAAESK